MNQQKYDNYIIKVIECGSLTNASKALGISQPALSQGLNNLEKEVGIKILDRKTNPITLTPEGKLYYEYIMRAAALSSNFEKKLALFRESASNKVRISAPAVYVDSLVTPSVARLLKKQDTTNVTIKTASLEESIELALSGEIDLFISTSSELPDNFTLEKIYQEEIVMCIPSSFDINKLLEKDFNLKYLKDQNFIFLEDSFPLQVEINEYLEKKHFTANNNIVVDQVSLAVKLASQGAGICFASLEAAKTAGKLLNTYKLGLKGRNIYLAYDKELYLPKAAYELIEIIRNSN